MNNAPIIQGIQMRKKYSFKECKYTYDTLNMYKFM